MAIEHADDSHGSHHEVNAEQPQRGCTDPGIHDNDENLGRAAELCTDE